MENSIPLRDVKYYLRGESRAITIPNNGNVKNLIVVGGGGGFCDKGAGNNPYNVAVTGGGGAVTVVQQNLQVKKGDILEISSASGSINNSGYSSFARLKRNGSVIWEYTAAGGKSYYDSSSNAGGQKTTQPGANTYSGGRGSTSLGNSTQPSEYEIATGANTSYLADEDSGYETRKQGGGSYAYTIGQGTGIYVEGDPFYDDEGYANFSWSYKGLVSFTLEVNAITVLEDQVTNINASITNINNSISGLANKGAPNWSVKESKSNGTTYTASSNGYLYVSIMSNSLYINGVQMLKVDFCSKHVEDTYLFPVKKGDTYSASNANWIYFVPVY